MGTLKKASQVLLFSAFGLFAVPSAAGACDCVGGRSLPPAQFGPRDIVFRARVIRSRPLEYVELEVLETFNGRVGRQVRVVTGGSDCDYFLPPVGAKRGNQFLIYGTTNDEGKLEVNRCGGSGPLSQKTRELEILRQRQRSRPK